MTTRRCVRVHLGDQRLELLDDGAVVASWPVSTSARGAGEREASGRTPRGRHEIRARIGAGQPEGAVFDGRRPTGEVCTPDLVEAEPGRDWILTRILWLRGLEPGRNRGGDVDSMRRWIYIHGTPDETSLGTPASHGCIRMRNADVVELFDRVEAGDLVEICE